jgi:DNA invertase Pin-like site-specific DNA recombinase
VSKNRRRAAVYLRISQDRAGDELGIARQRQDCQRLGIAKGWEIVEEFSDDDFSAFSGKPRPGYSRLLAALEAGGVDVVVAWHPDRLHRSPKELETFIDLIEKTGAQVATVQAGELDLSTAAGRMTARIVGSVARHESEQKSERMKRQREQAALQGRPHGGPRSYGYDETGLQVVEVEATLIREVAHRLLAGEGVNPVARDLNARGFRTVTGKEWTAQVLRQLMLAPRLAGLRVHRGQVVGPASWPPILDRGQHEQLTARFGQKRRAGRPPTALLTGLIVCGTCGARLQQSASRRDYRRYACHRAPGRDACGAVSIRADQTEELVIETVLQRLDTSALAALAAATPESLEDVAALEARMAELADAYGRGLVNMSEWMRARAPLEEQLERARHARDAAARSEPVLREFKAGRLRRAWPTLSLEERRKILGAVVERIASAPAERRARWDADRVTMVWRA